MEKLQGWKVALFYICILVKCNYEVLLCESSEATTKWMRYGTVGASKQALISQRGTDKGGDWMFKRLSSTVAMWVLSLNFNTDSLLPILFSPSKVVFQSQISQRAKKKRMWGPKIVP